MTAHKHQTILRGAAEELKRAGFIRTYDAVYRWVCPDCGMPQRTTRLADTIYALRHAYGWVITTHAESDMLAVYTLTKAGDMPGEDNGPHPRKLAGRDDHSATGIARRMAGEYTEPVTVQRASIHDYDGKPVPVEAIPSPERWRCERCGTIYNTPMGQPQLGGYRKGFCPTVGCSFSGGKRVTRIFIPVL